LLFSVPLYHWQTMAPPPDALIVRYADISTGRRTARAKAKIFSEVEKQNILILGAERLSA